MSIFRYYDLPEAELFVFDEFLVCQIREGMEIQPEHSDKLNEIIQRHFEWKNIVYISNRVNSYSVNPLTYVKAESIPNLVAIALVPDNEIMRKNAEYERTFYDKPYEIFDTLSQAIRWVHGIVKSTG